MLCVRGGLGDVCEGWPGCSVYGGLFIHITCIPHPLTNASPGSCRPQLEGGITGGSCEEVPCWAEHTCVDVVTVCREGGGGYGCALR